MPIRRHRLYLFAAALAVILPLAGLAYALAQGPQTSAGTVSPALNWAFSLVMCVISALLGVAVMWGTFRERVNTHTSEIKELKEKQDDFITRRECDLIERGNSGGGGAAAAAAAAALTVAQATERRQEAAHQDMIGIVGSLIPLAEGIKELLTRKD
jgi:hypothetical protein